MFPLTLWDGTSGTFSELVGGGGGWLLTAGTTSDGEEVEGAAEAGVVVDDTAEGAVVSIVSKPGIERNLLSNRSICDCSL